MGRPPLDYGEKIAAILDNVATQPPEAVCPIRHFHRTISDLRSLRGYVERKITDSRYYKKKMDDHMAALDRMLIVSVVETFERFLKEIAAACVEHLARCVLDDRFDFVSIKGGEIAAHFSEQTVGRALCESSTWLRCDHVNTRFQKLLSLPSKPNDSFHVFRNGKKDLFPGSRRTPYEIMSVVWQLRHTIVHNVGVLTQSDATKLQVLTQKSINAPCLLRPIRDDVRYVEEFLVTMAEESNQRCADRLAEVLTELHDGHPGLFPCREKAEAVSKDFQVAVTIGGVSVTP